MQKIFIKNTIFILTSAIFLILFIDLFITWAELKNQQFETFNWKIEQVIHTLESNDKELETLSKSLDDDYLTRAKAAAYVLDSPNVSDESMDVSSMQYLAMLLNVDELHIIDENGIIISSSVAHYIGIDMADYKQTREFLTLLDSEDEDAYLIQEMQPNGAEKKMIQYMGVRRKSKNGIVEVGFEPKRLMEARARHTYKYIFSRFPTDVNEELYLINCNNSVVLAHTETINGNFEKAHYSLETLLECTKGAFKKGINGQQMYIVSQQYEDVLICAAIPKQLLTKKLLVNAFNTFICLVLIEIIVVFLLNHLVKRNVIDGIHEINKSLADITNGDFDTMVTVGGNKEFEALSTGINTMVSSIINISSRMSTIIDITGIPLAAFEYDKGVNHLFITSRLGPLLDIPNEKIKEFAKDAQLFDKYMREITKILVEGEENVYNIHNAKFLRIHMSESTDGKLGVIMDVTESIIEKSWMRYENTHDPLTGLYKYQHFKQLSEEIFKRLSHGNLCAVVMMDLDFFKGINDTYGHDAGDKYLQKFAFVLTHLPKEHFLTARRSGDEFCMTIFGCKEQQEVVNYLEYFYEKLKENPIDLADTDTRVISVSSGFVCTYDATDDIDELISHADEALYNVKENSKGTYRAYLET